MIKKAKKGSVGTKANSKFVDSVKSLLTPLPDRARDIIERRYGLVGDQGDGMTLEAIGEIYGITRERVRQIENFAIESIRKSKEYEKALATFNTLEDYLVKHGGLAKEETILDDLSTDAKSRNQISFLLAVCESFVRLKEDDDFHHRWTVNVEESNYIHEALQNLHKELELEDLINESDFLNKFSEHLELNSLDRATDHNLKKWLGISKHVGANPLGEWGLATSPSVRTRGIRDYAYLVLRKHGEPLHFADVADQIEEMFDKSAHVATCHNELIKDDRFVLVGRGLYALSEWGYTNGVVRDVIKDVLKKAGPLSKSDIMERVLKQRQVKENTIYVNLQNPKYFHKTKEGKYQLA